MRPRFFRHPKRYAITRSLSMSARISLRFAATASRMAEGPGLDDDVSQDPRCVTGRGEWLTPYVATFALRDRSWQAKAGSLGTICALRALPSASHRSRNAYPGTKHLMC